MWCKIIIKLLTFYFLLCTYEIQSSPARDNEGLPVEEAPVALPLKEKEKEKESIFGDKEEEEDEEEEEEEGEEDESEN